MKHSSFQNWGKQTWEHDYFSWFTSETLKTALRLENLSNSNIPCIENQISGILPDILIYIDWIDKLKRGYELIPLNVSYLTSLT